MTRRRALIGLVMLALLGAGLAYSLRKSVSELPVYVRGGARMAAGEEIYRPNEPKAFTYPPFFAVPFVPLAALPEGAHRTVWYFVNVGALIGILMLLAWCLRPYLAAVSGRAPPVWVFWLVVALLAGRHVSAVFENQSHDLLVFLPLMLAIALSMRVREACSGAMVGLAAACKATPLLFLAVFVGQLRLLAAFTVVAAAAVATLLPDLLFPRGDGQLWVVAWADTFLSGLSAGKPAEAEGGTWVAWNMLNQNLAGMLHRLSTPIETTPHTFDVSVWNPGTDTLKYVTLGAQLGVLAFLGWIARPSLSRGLPPDELAFRRLGEGGAILCGMVLLSPMSSKSHFCVLLVPIAFCVADLLYRRRSVIVTVLLAFTFVFGTLTVKGLLGSSLGREFLARGTVTWCTLSVFVATGLILLRRPVEPAAR